MAPLLHRKGRILLLDDDPAIRRLVSTLLKREGYRVDTADSGSKAIDAIEKNAYMALLLDLMMPTEGGMTVIQHLRRKHPELLQRVVLLTATPDAIVKSMANDVFAVVKKPFQPKDLVDAVARLA